MTASTFKTAGRWLALPLAGGAGALAVAVGGWSYEQGLMAGILVLAAVLWITEAVPLFVTAVLVIGAETFLLANPGGWRVFGYTQGGGPTFTSVLNAAISPILVLFFAGLVMARAAVKEGVDQALGGWLLRPFVRSRRSLLFGVMGVTALFSMWMSNTATTAFMLTLTMPLLAQIPPADPFRRALLIAVPFAANIGGLGTPIASPPNAIALGYIRQAGESISFLGWMTAAVPLLLVLLVFLGWLLLKLFPSPTNAPFSLTLPTIPPTRRSRRVAVIFVVTVLLWLTEGIHGLPAAVVAVLPVLALLLGGFVQRDDINLLEWDVLILIAGGLALGYGVGFTGLDHRIVSLLPSGGGATGLVIVLLAATLALGTLLSNSAVANLLLPIALAAVAGSGRVTPALVAIAFVASLGMALPVSTPPNTMAYARGELRAADMAKAGIPLGLLGLGLVAGFLLLT
ncbi:MAG: DASS family sodium-coupled anion symporter [Opitutaceae bacterium]|nr:DASS family sodium-coupled anion symporter [Opitutaceae bacterium]